MIWHYSLTRQERTQITGRPHQDRAPLCGTGDGHWTGTHPDDWRGRSPAVNCSNCIERKHLIAPRERDRINWDERSRPNVVTLSLRR